jgi:mono/diheme cytochrome c family protein
MHNGRSADGRLLYPAFPYPSFTEITRADSDALYAWLHTLAPVAQPNRAHTLRFPYGLQPALAMWRALFFAPGVYEPVVDRSVQWNRGAYLVRSLGHCGDCHAARNAFGAPRDSQDLGGGLIPLQNWYAPSLGSRPEAGVAAWSSRELASLLKTGTTPHGATFGPMAEVVFRSTQYLSDADVSAMVEFLRTLPPSPSRARTAAPLDPAVRARGQTLYADHCASCHGAGGEGGAGPDGFVYAPLAGNRKVLLESPANLIHIVIDGGFPPTTAGNPRPYGMPPFGPLLNDADVAALTSYVRNAWGNAAPAVGALDVLKLR